LTKGKLRSYRNSRQQSSRHSTFDETSKMKKIASASTITHIGSPSQAKSYHSDTGKCINTNT
jgi:hypothetical protein